MLERSPMLWGLLKQERIEEDWALQLFAGSRLRLYKGDKLMLEQVPMFRASDGSVFPTEEEGKAHEAVIAQTQEFDEFIASVTDRPRGAATRIRNVLMEYSGWKANREV